MKKSLLLMMFAVLAVSCSMSGIKTEAVEIQSSPHSNGKLEKVSEIRDILGKEELNNKPIIIFSSRDYTYSFAVERKNTVKEIYWIVPDDELKPEDIAAYEKFLKESNINHEIKVSAEGVTGNINGIPVTILPRNGISTLVTDTPVVIADVDFFFRINKNKLTQPKSLDVITFYRTLDEYNIAPSLFVIVRSLDINLPHWVQEFSYLLEGIFPYWQKKELPVTFLSLDEADRLLNFAQYDEAYQLLKEVEKEHTNNPFFYEKLFWASMKTFRDTDLIDAADKAYKLDGYMINLYIDGTDYLLEKNELYPAYVLIKKAYNKEPWNKSVKAKFEEVVQFGYNYYNLHGDKELFEIFKKEKERLAR